MRGNFPECETEKTETGGGVTLNKLIGGIKPSRLYQMLKCVEK